ncbi:complement factor H-related protein 5-like [Mercenaria mercenaria]|uniref:complement factor H-related protein 5-like n=1 Tax=Mercenaria mercenaria TaxID=6596 RepID=UPI00234F0DEA|nr:complement factor H-related protein 5-like [Mercenaria mercenaria]
MKFSYLFLICLFSIWDCCKASQIGQIIFSRQLLGQKLNTLHGVSLELCAENCQRKGKCLSINYNRMMKLCEYNVATRSSEIQYNQSVGWIYSDIITWPHRIPSLCKDKSCSINDTCIVESETGHRCKIEECISPPGLENGVVLGNLNSVGSTVRLKCNSDFALVGQSFSVCLENYGWSSYGQCSKTCQTLPISNELRITTLTNESQSEVVSVTYECIGNLYIIGNATNYCANGTWAFELPQCISECPAGERYSNGSNSCVEDNMCPLGYTDTFTLYKNSVLPGEDSSGAILITESVSECMTHCITETRYECVSFDVYSNRTCYLQNVTGDGLGGLSYTTDFDYYQRDCLN